jgi:hypothetical protein
MGDEGVGDLEAQLGTIDRFNCALWTVGPGRASRMRPTVPGATPHQLAMRRSDQSGQRSISRTTAFLRSRKVNGSPGCELSRTDSTNASSGVPSKNRQAMRDWPRAFIA